MMKKREGIPIPWIVPDGAEEIVRIFRDRGQDGDGSLTFLLKTKNPKSPDPGYWGIVAVDLIRHAANALEGRLSTMNGPMSREEIMARMKKVFDAEWASPTDGAKRKIDA